METLVILIGILSLVEAVTLVMLVVLFNLIKNICEEIEDDEKN